MDLGQLLEGTECHLIQDPEAPERSFVRIRGVYHQTSTQTGRLAMDCPNLQNIPNNKAFTVPTTQTPPDGELRGQRFHEASVRYVGFWREVSHLRKKGVENPTVKRSCCWIPGFCWSLTCQSKEVHRHCMHMVMSSFDCCIRHVFRDPAFHGIFTHNCQHLSVSTITS
jgi:hypothetical protein